MFPEIPGKYQKAKWTETLAVTKAKTQLWEKFGEAMEQNIWPPNNSVEPLYNLGGESHALMVLYTVRKWSCWLQLRI